MLEVFIASSVFFDSRCFLLVSWLNDFFISKDFMADHDQQKLIEIDANLPAKAVFKVGLP